VTERYAGSLGKYLTGALRVVYDEALFRGRDTNVTRDQVVDKVRKLFELAKSSNENEAALAAVKARELLSKYNLAMADLPVEEINSSIEVSEAFVDPGRVVRNWVRGLIVHVSRGFECEHILRRRPGSKPLLSFIGTRADSEVAARTFRFLMRELKLLSDWALPELKRTHRGWNGQSLKNAYLNGAVVRIGERFEERARTVRVEELRCCKDLVIAKQQMIGRYMERTFGRVRREYGKPTPMSAQAFRKGYSDAGCIDLDQHDQPKRAATLPR